MNRALPLVDELLTLPPLDRAKAALRLLESLDQGEVERAERAWAGEIRARVEEVRAGTAEVVSADEALRMARDQVGRASSH